MFDNCGHCSISRNDYMGKAHWSAQVSFNHLTMAQAAEIGKLLGLGVLTDEGRPSKHQKCRWHFRIDEIPVFLDIVEPYVIFRHEHIRIMREFLALRGKPGEPLTQEVVDKRNECVARIQELTCGRGKRGSGPESSGGGTPVEGDLCRSGV
jgi:hypothetical protein